MSDPTYRIPTTGLFLETDGTLVPAPKAGATVVDATEALAAKLTAAYVGKGVQLMSNTGGHAPSGDATREALEALGDAAEGIVLVGEVVELGIKLAEFMGLLPHAKNPVLAKLERIDASLNAIDDLILAAWAASRRDQLAILRAHAATALRIAQEYLELNRPQSPVWASKIAQADRDSLFAVQAFTASGLNGGFWLRPFSLKAMGISPAALHTHTSWLTFHPDRDQLAANPGTPVWDYRFALPAAVYAIVTRLAVLKAVAPLSLQIGAAGCREMRGHGRFLRAVVQRIRDGIWTINELAADEWSRFLFQWDGRTPVAAAQMDSGYGFGRLVWAGQWESLRRADPALWPPGLVEPDGSFGQVNKNIQNVASHWWHLIWRNSGMLEMCRIISDVDGACTLPVYSRWIGDAQRKLIMASTDVTSRAAAAAASSLTHLTSAGDAAADSVRTFRLYESLWLENAAVQEVLARATEALLSFVPEPAEVPVRPEPVGWWRGDDDARDAISGTDGRVVGAVRFVPGHAGQAFAFSQGWHVEVPNAPALEPETLTVAAWVRRDAPPAENAYLLSKGASGCTAASYALHTGGTGGLVFYVSDGQAVYSSPDAGRALWDDAWHFVAGTYDGRVVRLFVDGLEVGPPTPATSEAIGYGLPDGDSLYLGAYRGTCDLRFDEGQLDEVRVFDRALTAAEIRDLYTDGP